MKTPVVVIIFRRPQLTARLLKVLEVVKPEHLLVVADGPRPGREDEAVACAETRALFDDLPWDCKVERCFSDENLGCGVRPSSGISWAFERVEEAIILEDDCIPDPSFFRFCEELLGRYRNDPGVMHISGCTYTERAAPVEESYYFSQYPACWGWATWRRAWQKFEYNVPEWKDLKGSPWLSRILVDQKIVSGWSKEFDVALEGGPELTGWDYQWAFACWLHQGLSAAPRRNLVSNIGAGDDATHTFWEGDPTMHLPVFKLDFPLRHPGNVAADSRVDRMYRQTVLLPAAGGDGRSFPVRCLSRIRRIVSKVMKLVFRSGPVKGRGQTVEQPTTEGE